MEAEAAGAVGEFLTTERALVLRPLFIARIALFALVLLFFIVGFFEMRAGFGSSGAAVENNFGSPFDVVSLVGLVCVLLWASWRNWRLGVRLSKSEITVFGFFRDRTVARSAVLDVMMTGELVWEMPDGKIRATPITAFSDLGGRLADFIVHHNARNLALLRRELVDASSTEEVVLSVEEDRSYDNPTYRRQRRREGPPKHAQSKRSRLDALPAIALLSGHIIATALAFWLVIEPALWLAGLTETPGMLRLFYSSEPFARDGAAELLLPHTVIAVLTLAMTIRLLYLMFRPSR